MSRSEELAGQLIVVSGGSGSLGQSITTGLAESGAQVVIFDINEPDWLVQGAPHNTIGFVKSDVSNEESVDKALDRVQDQYGKNPTTVCAHAGISHSAPIYQFDLHEFDEIFRVNVRGSYVLAKAITNRWLAAEQPGHLIFTASWVYAYPWPEIAPYSASKAAIVALMRSFARELAPNRIRANAVAPGIVSVGMAKYQWDNEPQYRERAERAIALGAMQDPKTVTDAFIFLCSDRASYMTGSVLTVDGGCSLVGTV